MRLTEASTVPEPVTQSKATGGCVAVMSALGAAVVSGMKPVVCCGAVVPPPFMHAVSPAETATARSAIESTLTIFMVISPPCRPIFGNGGEFYALLQSVSR